MTIPISKYISIESTQGGSTSVGNRSLSLRLFTESLIVPSGTTTISGDVYRPSLEFTSAEEVASYFGTESQEYKRSSFYFGWVSKNANRPKKISFCLYNDRNIAPAVYGGNLYYSNGTVNNLKTITNGTLSIEMNGAVNNIYSIDLSSASPTLDSICTLIRTAISISSTDPMYQNCTVTYNSGKNAIEFVGGSSILPTVIRILPNTTGQDLAALLNWYSTVPYPRSAVWLNGALQQTITDCLNASANTNNNFGSFGFIPELTTVQNIEAAQWNATRSELFMFLLPARDLLDSTGYANALSSLQGNAITYSPLTGQYPELIPGMIEAATDYLSSNSVQDYAFQQFAVTPSVADLGTSNALDALNVNYVGLTQTAGQYVAFYQPGVLTGQGISSNITSMTTYANEAWFKDAIMVVLLRIKLASLEIPANQIGVALLLTAIETVITQAKNNGTISVGTLLSSSQIAYVSQVTNDPNAWRQIQSVGVWKKGAVQEYQEGGQTKYKFVYTIVYKKDDVISKIEGHHILI